MNNRIRRILMLSVVGSVLLSVLIFFGVTFYMEQKSTDSINKIGEIYMSGMNQQIQQKFSSIIELRLSQIDGLIQRTPPEDFVHNEEMIEELRTSARVRDFHYLALYTKDGKSECIYGTDIQATDAQEFREILTNDGKRISKGIDADGQQLLLLVVPANYKMENGQTSDLMIVGISMEYFRENLFINESETTAYSHIINSDGDFVIRGGDAFRMNFFERIEESWENYEDKEIDDYVSEIKQALEERKNYSTVIKVNGERRHLYMSELADSEWFLVSVLPFGELDEIVMQLDGTRTNVMLAASGCVLIMLLGIFWLYYRITWTQMVELEEARKEAVHANSAKSEFLSNMSHDIRTPMNAIVGMTEIAIKNSTDSERVNDCLDKIRLSSKHLLGLINDVLDMSKIESGKMKLNMDELSLKDAMKDIVQIMQPQFRSKHQQFDIFIENISVEKVMCDHVRLNQVLLNLLSNSYKFTPDGGIIHVYLSQENSPIGDAYIRLHIQVCDNGIGMSEEFQKEIFGSFTREQSEQVNKIIGTGLGMAITKHIVDAMNGTIEVRSQLGKGSKFHITLDLKKAVIKGSEMILSDYNVLVVDDNQALCLSAMAALQEMHVNAEYVLSGEEALVKIEQHHQQNNDYHFVLLDWKMPGMDGLQTMREIKQRMGSKIPVFLISAYDWSDIEDEIKDAGIAGFIPKPLFKSTLYAVLKQYIDGKTEVKEDEPLYHFVGKRLLLAEDNELNYEIASDILSDVGFVIDWAENGQICVDKFNASMLHTYDAILMDIRMPVMNGYDAARAIRASKREDHDIPIIAMSADAFAEDIRRSLECGMNAHTPKPIDIDEVMKLLQKYIK